ncbi:hypothetical protein ECG_01411 [Echinococcus granulosus]|nr:hypothetical protein ECG_01411 [Echinococcus granulosus]
MVVSDRKYLFNIYQNQASFISAIIRVMIQAQVAQMTTSKLTTYSIIISGIIIILCTNFCTNAKTHLIYWSPLNIIFRVKPAAVLHVEQRDRVIFVCPKDEYFILWTYKKHAFDNCSNPIDNGNTVNILYRCSFRDPINTAVPKGVNLSEMNIWLPQMPVTNRSFAATASTSLAFRRARLPSVARQPRGPAKRSAGRVEGETFTLLINEFAWSTGTPSFQKDRPVYFTAQPKICLEENMRLTIVQGEIARSRDDAIPQRGLAPILELHPKRYKLDDFEEYELNEQHAIAVLPSSIGSMY